MKRPRSLPFALCALLVLYAARPAAAQTAADTAHIAVLAAVDGLFGAMARRDTAAARALLLPSATLTAVPAGGDAPGVPRHQSGRAFVAGLAVGTEKLLERMWAPIVLVDGPVAHVWARYDFHVGGAFSHCGTDSFALVRTGDGWRLSSLVYTVQRAGCAPSPLGPPE